MNAQNIYDKLLFFLLILLFKNIFIYFAVVFFFFSLLKIDLRIIKIPTLQNFSFIKIIKKAMGGESVWLPKRKT